MTVEGKKKLEAELKRLKEKERPAIVKAIDIARSHGDLSENAEYHSAKEKQGFIETNIAIISSKLADAEVIDISKIKSDKVTFGATVFLENLETEEKVNYKIVGEDEADIKEKKIYIMSPIARSLIGKKRGDQAIVKTPKGEIEYEILKIEYK